jgi:hypothetical protein
LVLLAFVEELSDELALLEAGWAELLSGVAALLLLLQPIVISPNASRTSKLCFIKIGSFGDIQAVRCMGGAGGWAQGSVMIAHNPGRP